MSPKEIKRLEKNLKNKEDLIIKDKAKYIMVHSDAILEKINKGDESFLINFVTFLMADSDSDFGIDFDINEYDYCKSLDVIFKICYALPYLGFDEIERKNIRNKIRLYTKEFKAEYDFEFKNNCKYVFINEEEYKKSLKLTKKTI